MTSLCSVTSITTSAYKRRENSRFLSDHGLDNPSKIRISIPGSNPVSLSGVQETKLNQHLVIVQAEIL